MKKQQTPQATWPVTSLRPKPSHRFRATHGVIHLSDFGREEMEDSDQALEIENTQATELQEVDHFEIIITQKIELNIKRNYHRSIMMHE